MDDSNLYTPQELMDEFPRLAEFGLNATRLVMLFNRGILKGRRVNRQVLITLESLKALMETKTRFQKQTAMHNSNLYTPQELVNKFPRLAEFGWTTTKLDTLFNRGILKGRRINRQVLISLESLKKLVITETFFQKQSGMEYKNLYTLQELADELGWSATRLGMLFTMGILKGRRVNRQQVLIPLESIEELITWYKKQTAPDNSNLYTPQELVDEFPILTDFGWTATRLGMLFNMGILKGHRVIRQLLIPLESVKELMETATGFQKRAAMDNSNLYTPQELADKFPHLAEFGFTVPKLAMLIKMLIIRVRRGNKQALIMFESIIEFMETATDFQKRTAMDHSNLYPPQELVNKFPRLTEFGWTATKLAVLFNMGILKGRIVNRRVLITLESLKELMATAPGFQKRTAMDNSNLHTPQELMNKFPRLAKFGWTATTITKLFHMGILKGRIVNKRGLITLESLKEFVEHYIFG